MRTGLAYSVLTHAQVDATTRNLSRLEAGWVVFRNDFLSVATPPAFRKATDEGNDVTFRSTDGNTVADVTALDGPNASIILTDQDAKVGPTGSPSSACANMPPIYSVKRATLSAYSCIGKNGKIVYEIQKFSNHQSCTLLHIEYPESQKVYWDKVVGIMSHSLSD
jgi:hypothetical protein